MNIYVGNMAYGVTDAELKSAFEAYGSVVSASVIMDQATGRSKGFGFVEMTNDNEALEAINALNGKDLKGRKINVNQARPRERDSRGSGPRGGGGGRPRY